MIIASLAALMSATCLSFPAPGGDPAYPFPDGETWAPVASTEVQRLISQGGASLVGKKTIVVNGVTYPNDCTGLVRAAYAFAAIDLAYRFDRYSGNGVRRLHETLKDEGLLYAVRYPAPADLVFWDNTYDANGNGQADDELTHVGVVLSAEADGSIRYLHYHVRLGPVIEGMNLTRPDDESDGPGGRVNAFIRMRGSPGAAGGNAAQLFRVFGRGYELKP
ncbi:MAG: CHAP domain-containing protein [Spirochaetae bacterium HGW-Spirochaetae-7]|nr:MAG: CHAP domain-containing protein [Spirochaetae bacterium HGW-Spirochaetae-7]